MEELNVKIEVLEHFYTQEGFMQSRFRDNEQLLTVYYIVKIIGPENFRIIDTEIEKPNGYPFRLLILSASHRPFGL